MQTLYYCHMSGNGQILIFEKWLSASRPAATFKLKPLTVYCSKSCSGESGINGHSHNIHRHIPSTSFAMPLVSRTQHYMKKSECGSKCVLTAKCIQQSLLLLAKYSLLLIFFSWRKNWLFIKQINYIYGDGCFFAYTGKW